VWDGSAWHMQHAPHTNGPRSQLRGVSCPVAASCVAAGGDGKYAFAEAWDGDAWTIEPLDHPRHSTYALLSGVSCATTTSCRAVGFFDRRRDIRHTFVERWDGSTWTHEPSPDPDGAGASYLSSVVCTDASTCIAVGHSEDAEDGSESPLAEVWYGDSWSIVPTRIPRDSLGSVELRDVSCAGPNACVAVGSYIRNTGRFHTLVEAWDGARWTIERTPRLDRHSAELDGVACLDRVTCVAIGTVKSHPLAEVRT
jgi:hypothetical protein